MTLRYVPPDSAFSLDGGRLRQRQPRSKNEKHLKFIRTLPCLTTGTTYQVEAAHIRYRDPRFDKRKAGIGEKPDDRWTVPLCAHEHREGKDAQHNRDEATWWESRGIDPVVVAARLYAVSGDYEQAVRIIEQARSPR